jgi:DNA methylase
VSRAHSQFEKIPISKERQIMQLEQQINEIEAAISEMKYEKSENWSVKQMAIFRGNLEAKLEKLSAEEKKDDLLTFEQLGVDMMFVDEAHFFKNCFVFTKLRNVAGITTSSSQRAFDMLLKCQYLQEVNNGRGVIFATGTPISNSLSEMYVMQRYLQPQELERFGWSYFDTWAAHFGKRTSALEIKPEGGGYRMRDRFAKFYNMPELMAVYR